MTATRTITTEQAPSSRPLTISLPLTTDWQTFIDTPVYDIPLVGFGSSRRIAPGVSEPSGPILVANTSDSQMYTVSVRVVKSDRPLIGAQDETDYQRPDGEGGTEILFNGGADYAIGNVLIMDNNADVTVDNVDINGGVTEFTIGAPGNDVEPDAVIEVDAFSGTPGPGLGFTLSPDRDNLDPTVNVFYLMKDIQVEPDDVMMLPVIGQFFLSRELMQLVSNDPGGNLVATVSYTEGQAEEDQIFF